MPEFTVYTVVRAAAETAVSRRDAWDELDAAAADGDFGTTMARGFGSVLDEWDAYDRESEAGFLTEVSHTITRAMGGSSGPLWAEGFLRAASALDADAHSPAAAVEALRRAVEGVRARGGAEPGDKTMLDALIPALDALSAEVSRGTCDPAALVTAAAEAARTGAEATAGIRARRGRAAYSGDRSIGSVDPGAAAVAAVLAELVPLAGGRSLPPVSVPGESAGAQAPATKQLINDPAEAVDQALAGLALAHADIVTWDEAQRIVVRATPHTGTVGVISGGGSGHEPLHSGFVGHGMLTAVAPGPVFASPTVHQVLAATLAADAGAGVLHVVKNYTGDVMNFREAAELAEERGVTVRTVVISDDTGADVDHAVGRRGTGATVLVEKIAGAAAQAGASLEEVTAVARRAAGQAVSFGVALGSCSPPGRAPILELGANEIEVGVGIHGEPGRHRAELVPASEIVDEAVRTLLGELPAGDGGLADGDGGLLAFVSGLGGTTLLEQHLVYGELERAVRAAGRRITRRLVGPYLTALDMPGVLLTLLQLDDELTGLWDAPVHTPGLRWSA